MYVLIVIFKYLRDSYEKRNRKYGVAKRAYTLEPRSGFR